MVVRVGIVDLISMAPDSMTRRVFLEAVSGASAHLDLAGARGLDVAGAREDWVQTTVFGINPLGSPDTVDWAALSEMDALIISGSEPTTGDIADEPCLAIIGRILEECADTASLLFSCHSAHAALHLLHGLGRERLTRRRHGVFAHTVYPDLGATDTPATPIALAGNGVERLTAGLSGTVPLPHSRWNVMTSADLRAAAVPILLDSTEAQWQLAASPDGLRHVYLQGHPEYFCDTMAREYRRDLRRWMADPTLPFPNIPLGYFPTEIYDRLVEHAELVRTHRDPTLLEDFPLPLDHSLVAQDWSGYSRQFFANWLQAVEEACTATERMYA